MRAETITREYVFHLVAVKVSQKCHDPVKYYRAKESRNECNRFALMSPKWRDNSALMPQDWRENIAKSSRK